MKLNWLDQNIQGAFLTNTNVQPLYDEIQFGLTNAADVYVFQTGQATRSRAQTNLTLPGQLATPDQFVMRGIALALRPRSSAPAGYVATGDSLQDIADFQRMLWASLFSFTVNSTQSPVVYGHPALFPAGLGLEGVVATGGATSSNLSYIVGNGVRQIDNVYNFGPAYAELIVSGTTFRGAFSFNDGTMSLTASFSTKVYMTGFWSQASR